MDILTQDDGPYGWIAYDRDTYCGCQECASKMPLGHGKTEQEAIADLKEQAS